MESDWRFELRRGDAVLGHIWIERSDQPWMWGRFEAAAAFAHVMEWFGEPNVQRVHFQESETRLHERDGEVLPFHMYVHVQGDRATLRA